MILYALLLALLVMGAATGWLVHRRHGLRLAVLAGLTVALGLPVFGAAAIAAVLMAFPPLGVGVAIVAGVCAVNAYDRGQVFVATSWAVAATTALACAGVQL
ncbi:hypothetical protein [Streptomyces sp. EKS3.2]|uniref:hypothetical protein n=1 Tax=Streptomyces sp. EKS3.2 TaxID=3461008 RepID=UPI004041A759